MNSINCLFYKQTLLLKTLILTVFLTPIFCQLTHAQEFNADGGGGGGTLPAVAQTQLTPEQTQTRDLLTEGKFSECQSSKRKMDRQREEVMDACNDANTGMRCSFDQIAKCASFDSDSGSDMNAVLNYINGAGFPEDPSIANIENRTERRQAEREQSTEKTRFETSQRELAAKYSACPVLSRKLIDNTTKVNAEKAAFKEKKELEVKNIQNTLDQLRENIKANQDRLTELTTEFFKQLADNDAAKIALENSADQTLAEIENQAIQLQDALFDINENLILAQNSHERNCQTRANTKALGTKPPSGMMALFSRKYVKTAEDTFQKEKLKCLSEPNIEFDKFMIDKRNLNRQLQRQNEKIQKALISIEKTGSQQDQAQTAANQRMEMQRAQTQSLIVDDQRAIQNNNRRLLMAENDIASSLANWVGSFFGDTNGMTPEAKSRMDQLNFPKTEDELKDLKTIMSEFENYARTYSQIDELCTEFGTMTCDNNVVQFLENTMTSFNNNVCGTGESETAIPGEAGNATESSSSPQ